RAHTPQQLAEHLAQQLPNGPPYEAVCITHNETSTGVLEPLRELAAVARERVPDALVLADCVSALGGAPLEFDAFGLDLAFAGTPKCLALPPGLVTYALSRRALERARTVEGRGFLFDFVRAVPETEAGKTLATPCVPMVFALQRQLERVLAEGMQQRWARHASMRQATMQWAQQQRIEPFVAAAARSPTVSCLSASGRDVKQLAETATRAGFKIDQGYGDLKGRTFRIGHMGDHTVARLQELLAALAR